jgi:hypothetical protein
LLLLALVASAALMASPGDAAAREATAAPAPVATGLTVALTLVIAVTTANLFHQGYWQRVWAAADVPALRRGAMLGGIATMLVIAILGGLGLLAAGRGLELGNPPIPFFALLAEAPAWLALPALVLGITLVASSVDTLQNALVSLGASETGRLGLRGARILTALLMLPVVVLALQQVSVLRLFLIADLLCATAVVPLLSALSHRASTTAAALGCLAGVVGAIAPGVITGGSLAAGLSAASFPAATPTLGPFLGALVASTLITATLMMLQPVSRRRSAPD